MRSAALPRCRLTWGKPVKTSFVPILGFGAQRAGMPTLPQRQDGQVWRDGLSSPPGDQDSGPGSLFNAATVNPYANEVLGEGQTSGELGIAGAVGFAVNDPLDHVQGPVGMHAVADDKDGFHCFVRREGTDAPLDDFWFRADEVGSPPAGRIGAGWRLGPGG